MDSALDILKNQLRNFAQERDWEKFHSPKNLSMAITIESAELSEIFQWLTTEESKNLDDDMLDKVRDEVGDILIFLVRFCDVLEIEPVEAALTKIKKNELKYPVHLSKGNAQKYDKLR
jgi:NTP pyrophosphatase (non-canonical NTP hydrolase)